MRVAFSVVSAVAVACVSTTSPAQTGSQAAGAQQYPHQLTSSELQALIPDSTSYSRANGGPKAMANYKSVDGRAHIRSPDFEDFGTWRITDDNLLCTKYNRARSGQENCQTVWKTGPDSFEAHLAGGQIVKVTGWVPGNPEGL
jgi:hypothetical protein